MARYKGYMPDDVEVRGISLADIPGTPLDPSVLDEESLAEMLKYNDALMGREMMVLGDMGDPYEKADLEDSQRRQQEVLDELIAQMARDMARLQSAPGSLSYKQSLQVPALKMQDYYQEANPTDSLSFGAAFRAARKAGAKTFSWRGKKYTTKVK